MAADDKYETKTAHYELKHSGLCLGSWPPVIFSKSHCTYHSQCRILREEDKNLNCEFAVARDYQAI